MSKLSRVQGVTIFEVDQEYDSLDELKLSQLGTELLAAVEQAQPPALLLDLTQTTFIGSSFLGLAIRAWKRLRDRNGRMALCHVNELCSEVLHASKLDSIWDVYPNRDEAIQRMSEKSA